MIRKSLDARWKVILGIVSLAVLIGGYTWLSHRQHGINPKDTTIPGWGQLGEGLQKIFGKHPRTGERWFWEDSKATATRLFAGLSIGLFGAVVLGLGMGCFRFAEAVLAPPLALLAKVPPTAALAVFFVMAGTGNEMFVAMVAFGILPTMAQSVYLSVKEVPDELLYKAYTLGASNSELIWNIVFRFTLPKMLDAARLQIGPAMVYLIAAEMVCGDVGFGFRIRLQSRLLNMDVVYPYLAALAAFGFTMDYGLRWLQEHACPWHSEND